MLLAYYFDKFTGILDKKQKDKRTDSLFVLLSFCPSSFCKGN